MVPDAEGRERIGRHRWYERSTRNRERAIELHGTACKVCGFDFDDVVPLSEHEGVVDPATGLVPPCASCHRMAHKRGTSVTSVEKLRALIRRQDGA